MELDQYAYLDSPLHSWDARWKLVSLLLLIFIGAAAARPVTLMTIGSTAVLLTLLSRIPLRFVLRTLKAPFILILLMAPLLVLTGGGTPLASWGIFKLSLGGLKLSGRIAAKALSIMLLFICLFGTARLHHTLKAAESFKVPPVLLAVLLFTYRYIFLYLEDLRKLLTAARMRGYALQRGLKHIRGTVSLSVTLLIRSYEQSERVYAAMTLRGFTGSFQAMTRFDTRGSDAAKSALIGLLTVFCLLLETVWMP